MLIIFLFLSIFLSPMSLVASSSQTPFEESIENPIIFVKKFGEKKYRIIFPVAPQKYRDGDTLIHEARIQNKVYRLTYYPKTTLENYKKEEGLTVPPFTKLYPSVAEQIGFSEESHGLFCLTLQNGSLEEFSAFQQSFEQVHFLPI